MHPITDFIVVPSIPEPLRPLKELSYNLWWSWNFDAVALFRRIDSDLWEDAGHNPVRLLGMVSEDRLKELAEDDAFLSHLERVRWDLTAYLSRSSWYHQNNGDDHGRLIAYFSLEFAITEALPIYSGGLGALAGDHLKSASDLGVPLVAVGLLYQEGYFRQQLTLDGYQTETYPRNDFYHMPVRLAVDGAGEPILVSVDIAGEEVKLRTWRAEVGNVQLLLLDAHVPGNTHGARAITNRLYGGDNETRILQEIVLGIGGVRSLRALGYDATVYHLNEGHAGFCALERIRHLQGEHDLTFDQAREAVQASTVFTTHTPVPAGHDRFSRDLITKYFSAYVKQLGITVSDLMALGRENGHDGGQETGELVMTALALRMAAHSNGVSRLHGKVSREMWQGLWPGVPVDEVGIGHVTNGVHVRSWISHDLAELYDNYLGPGWVTEPGDLSIWERVRDIPSLELWGTHERRRQRLVAFVRRRLRANLTARGAPEADISGVDNLLNPQILTIGFARRFATYKRAGLLLSDPERLKRLLCDPERPVQLIFAGKAHPRDEEGKRLIQNIVEISRDPDLRRHVVFLENYDLDAARYLVQGVDVWLNTPRPPMEASGTSGMKAAANGAINLSVLDGWWHEAYTPEVGWAIGGRDSHPDPTTQDRIDAGTLYDLLENAVVPLFYDRAVDVVPHCWIAKTKESISTLASIYNTNRMVREYCERFYIQAHDRATDLVSDDTTRIKGLAWWKGHLRAHWKELRLHSVESDIDGELSDGTTIAVRVSLFTGKIKPEDVNVQIYEGPLDPMGQIDHPQIVEMNLDPDQSPDSAGFAGSVTCRGSGRHGFTVRVLPRHSDLPNPVSLGLVLWA